MAEILVLFGSHRDLESLVEVNCNNLAELIRRKHGVERPFINTSLQAQDSFRQLVHESLAVEKHVYYVGHGGNQGQLVFEDGEVFLQNCLRVEGAPQLARHPQTLELHLFMCYQNIAWEEMNEYLQQPGIRDIYQHLNLVKVPYLTQARRDQMNQRIQARQLEIEERGILTEKTMGDPEFGHFNLYNELQLMRGNAQQQEAAPCI